jgi:hypothetical protein
VGNSRSRRRTRGFGAARRPARSGGLNGRRIGFRKRRQRRARHGRIERTDHGIDLQYRRSERACAELDLRERPRHEGERSDVGVSIAAQSFGARRVGTGADDIWANSERRRQPVERFDVGLARPSERYRHRDRCVRRMGSRDRFGPRPDERLDLFDSGGLAWCANGHEP